MKDKEPKINQEEKFNSLTEEIVKELQNTSAEFKGITTTISRMDFEEGTRALYLDSNGKWSGRIQMMSYPLRDINSVIIQYASINDACYQDIERKSWITNESKRQNYIQKNKKSLLNGLLTKMESVLRELQTINQ